MIGKAAFGLFIAFFAFFLFKTDGFARKYFPVPGYDTSSIPDLTGKVFIITGGSTGVGRASAEQICKNGAKLVIITSRSQASADKAAQQIQQQYCSKSHQSKVIGKGLALEDYKDIAKFASWFRSLNEPLNVLMLNAGFGDIKNERTPLGLEKTIGVNWFGHFYLQQLLQDIVERSVPSRIVIVSSDGAALAPPLDKPIDAYVEGYEAKGVNQYLISKVFNVYHATELHRRLIEKGIKNVYVNAIHPGLVATNIFDRAREDKNYPFNYIEGIRNALASQCEGSYIYVILAIFADSIGLAPLDGSLTQLYAATSPEIEKLNISGEFFYPIARRESKSWYYFGKLSYLPTQARDQNLAKKLWEYGESLIAKLPKDQ